MSHFVNVQHRGQFHVPDPFDPFNVVVQVFVERIEVLFQVDPFQPRLDRILIVCSWIDLIGHFHWQLTDRLHDYFSVILIGYFHVEQIGFVQNSILFCDLSVFVYNFFFNLPLSMEFWLNDFF